MSGLTEGVKEIFAVDGVDVLIFGAEGDVQTQFNQIENCISQEVDGMIVMAALEPEGVASAVLEAKVASIKVMGVPVDEKGPFDAIMHTDLYENERHPLAKNRIGLGIMRRIMGPSPHSFDLETV